MSGPAVASGSMPAPDSSAQSSAPGQASRSPAPNALPAISKPLRMDDPNVTRLSAARAPYNRMPDVVSRLQASGKAHPQMAILFQARVEDIERTHPDKKPEFSITNVVDDEPCPPFDFEMTDGYVYTPDAPPSDPTDPDNPLVGCRCDDECEPETCLCYTKHIEYCRTTWTFSKELDKKFAYLPDGRLTPAFMKYYDGSGAPIFECNSVCKCSDSCHNRVVQKGRPVGVDLYKSVQLGWGVRPRHPVQAGTFVMSYPGELVTDKEADRRGKIYDRVGSTYMFDLDNWHIKEYLLREPYRRYLRERNRKVPDSDEALERRAAVWAARTGRPHVEDYSVDGGLVGGLARFVNHSCEPNLGMWPVYVDEPRLERPLLCLFALRDIARAEPFSLSYFGSADSTEEAMGTAVAAQAQADASAKQGDPSSRSLGVLALNKGTKRSRALKATNDILPAQTSLRNAAHADTNDAAPGTEIPIVGGGIKTMKCLCGAPSCTGYVFRT